MAKRKNKKKNKNKSLSNSSGSYLPFPEDLENKDSFTENEFLFYYIYSSLGLFKKE